MNAEEALATLGNSAAEYDAIARTARRIPGLY